MLERLIDTLSPLALRHLWQVTLTVAVLLLLARAIGRRSAHWAYALLIVAALKCLCPPVCSLVIAPFCWWGDGGRPSQAVRQSADESIDSASESLVAGSSDDSAALADEPTTALALDTIAPGANPETTTLAEEQFKSSGDLTSTADVSIADTPQQKATAAAPSQVDTRASISTIDWTRFLLAGLLLMWLAGCLFLLMGIVLRRRRLAKIVARGKLVTDGPIFQLVDQLQADLGLDIPMRVVILQEPGVPGVFGVRRPTVVLPRVVLDRMSPHELRLVLAHELNHLRRQDTVCGTVQLLAQVAWWFHPLVWWMNSHLRRYREHCCDEEVVARLRCRPGEYARCLLNVLSLRQELKPVVGVSALSPFDVTALRLRNLMRQERSFCQRRSWLCVAASVLLAAVLLPGAALPREAAMESTARSQSIPLLDELVESEPVTHIYRSGIIIPEPVTADPQETAPPELTYRFDLQDSPSYQITIEADEPKGIVTVDGTIAWTVHELSDGEMTISRLPTAIMRSQAPRMNNGLFSMPSIPSVTWHGMHGPLGPAGVPGQSPPPFWQGHDMRPPEWPSHLNDLNTPLRQATMSTHQPGGDFPDVPSAWPEPDRFSLSGGATHLGDPIWLPYGVGDAIDWILAPLPDSLAGGNTDRTLSWTIEDTRLPRGIPMFLTSEQAHETANWQVVSKDEREWVLSREVTRSSTNASGHQLRGTATITWAVDLGRPRGIEFTGEFVRADGEIHDRVPVNVSVIAHE